MLFALTFTSLAASACEGLLLPRAGYEVRRVVEA